MGGFEIILIFAFFASHIVSVYRLTLRFAKCLDACKPIVVLT